MEIVLIYTSRNSFRLLNARSRKKALKSTQVEILLGYLTLYLHTYRLQSTQVEILLGYLTSRVISCMYGSTQVEILLGYLTHVPNKSVP